MKILFITATRVGDAVLTTGLLAWMAKRYPDASFTIACGVYCADLFQAVPRLERLIPMKKRKWNGHWIDLWKQCRHTKWDLIVDMRNSLVSRLLPSKKRAIHKATGKVHKVLDIASALKLASPPSPHIWMTKEASRNADALLPRDKTIIAFGPAANWPHKQWPVEHYAKLAQALTDEGGPLPGAYVMTVCDKHERTQVEPLLKAIPAERRIDLIGKDLQTVAACLSRVRLYVGNDSGLMHLSAALGTPTLGLFGPGFPNIYGPWGERCAYVTTPETRDELISIIEAQKPDDPPCMHTLTVETALQAAIKLLVKTNKP